MDQAVITVSSRLRVIYVALGVIMLALWGASLIPPIETWGDPNEDGLSYVPAFWATITCLPVGFFLLAGAAAGRGRHAERARTARWLAAGLLALVVAFLIFQYIGDSSGGS